MEETELQVFYILICLVVGKDKEISLNANILFESIKNRIDRPTFDLTLKFLIDNKYIKENNNILSITEKGVESKKRIEKKIKEETENKYWKHIKKPETLIDKMILPFFGFVIGIVTGFLVHKYHLY